MAQSYPEAEGWWATVEQAVVRPIPEGQRSVEIMSHGTMAVKYYAPREMDEQWASPGKTDTLK